MKKALYFFPVGMLFLCASVNAQKANIDSLKLVAQISQDQLQLGKLQNMVYQTTKNKEGAAVDAQNSASDNATAAERLNADPDNKKLANSADSKASEAKSDAKKSRKQSEKLDDLNQKIINLKSKIADEQYKLTVYNPIPLAPNVLPTPITVKVDTTQHP